MNSKPPIAPEYTGGSFIAGGRRVACPVPVATWKETGLLPFKGLKPRARTQRLVLHWTASENGRQVVHSTLSKGGLSVHFLVEPDGTIVQFCDADMLCAHATGMNVDSIGIEVVNRATGIATGNQIITRTLLREKIRGVDVVYTSFTVPQRNAIKALVPALCAAYRIPVAVPVGPDGRLWPNEFRNEAERDAFTGVCGHLHWSPKKKVDPGLAVLRMFEADPAREAIGLDGPAQ